MAKTYYEAYRDAKYKLTGNGPRVIGALMEAFEGLNPCSPADIYGNGPLINDFEEEISQLLGKENAVFFPSGTMAQQIALRMWSDLAGTKKVAYHPLCHLEIHEKDGLKVLHQIEPFLLGSADRLFTLEDLKSIAEPLACVLIELPQREIGGQLPSWQELVEISEYCKSKGIRLHLDGARLFEALPYYEKSAAEVCSLFDSVYVSFYKGLGGIAGAALAGSKEFMEESKVWKRRHGGDLISLYPYIINARHCMKLRMNKMQEYWQHAKYVAEELNKIDGIKTVPQIPVCNMFHVYFEADRETLETICETLLERHSVGTIPYLREIEGGCMSEFSFGDSICSIPRQVLQEAFAQLQAEMRKRLD